MAACVIGTLISQSFELYINTLGKALELAPFLPSLSHIHLISSLGAYIQQREDRSLVFDFDQECCSIRDQVSCYPGRSLIFSAKVATFGDQICLKDRDLSRQLGVLHTPLDY